MILLNSYVRFQNTTSNLFQHLKVDGSVFVNKIDAAEVCAFLRKLPRSQAVYRMHKLGSKLVM